MPQGSTFFLRLVIFFIGLGVLALCLFVLPLGIMTDRTDYYRPLLAGMYLPAIPFFLALYQGLKLLRYIETNKAFSPLSVKALKNIKYCAIAISVLYAAGLPYIFYVGDQDDAPGIIVVALVIIAASFVIAVFAALLQKLLKNAIDIKAENDLTV